MGLFNSKPKATTSVKNELNKELEHLTTVQKKLNTTDIISTYFSSFEEMLKTYARLQQLENNYNWKKGDYRWEGGVMNALQNIENKRPGAERAFVNRAYERLQRECLKLSSEKAKENKRKQFFEEMEHYYKYLTDSTINYINSLKQ